MKLSYSSNLQSFFGFKKSFKALGLAVAALSSLNVLADSYLIKNATLHTATAKGRLDNADLLIQDRKIIQIGVNLKPAAEDIVIDCKGKHVTPGLLNASTNLGLVEIGAVSSTVDASTDLDGMGASFKISPAINFRSTLIPQNRINGLTRAIVMPRNGKSIFSGQGAAIALHSNDQGLLIEQVAQGVNFGARKGGGSRAATYAMLDKALSEAKFVNANPNRFAPGEKYEFSLSVDDLKALKPVLSKKMPLVVSANRSDDILNLIKLKRKYGFQLVITGAKDAWLVAKEIAAAGVVVMLDPMNNLPGFDSLSVRLDGAARLYQAGVKLILTGGGSHNAYLVRQSAGNAVAYGLPKQVAIEAMTVNPAEVFKIKNYGQLEVGMEADVVVWDGDPLDVSSSADFVFIQGEKQQMVSRATRLKDRYWQLKGNNQQGFIK